MFVDLGMAPLCERFLTPAQFDGMELKLHLCVEWFLVQLHEQVAASELF